MEQNKRGVPWWRVVQNKSIYNNEATARVRITDRPLRSIVVLYGENKQVLRVKDIRFYHRPGRLPAKRRPTYDTEQRNMFLGVIRFGRAPISPKCRQKQKKIGLRLSLKPVSVR